MASEGYGIGLRVRPTGQGQAPSSHWSIAGKMNIEWQCKRFGRAIAAGTRGSRHSGSTEAYSSDANCDIAHGGPLWVVRAVPPATVVRFNGERLSAADLVGQVAILNFRATWCAPCHSERPPLSRYFEERAAADRHTCCRPVHGRSAMRVHWDCFRHVAGATPNWRLNARLKAASES